MESLEKGTLYVVATPLGNLGDISRRALDVLARVDWIAAEDTRHSQKLLQHFGITNRLISLHNYNEQTRVEMLRGRLAAGEVGALISDAGTPLISDPGYHLVSQLREAAFEIRPVPGPSALITALSVSGLATDRFYFEGFLPAKKTKRQARLRRLNQHSETLICYEAPHRLLATLADLIEVLGSQRVICVAREMTKHYEEFRNGPVADVYHYFVNYPEKVRGEMVILIAGAPVQQIDDQAWQALVCIMLEQSLTVKSIAEVVSSHYQINKKQVYQWAQTYKDVSS